MVLTLLGSYSIVYKKNSSIIRAMSMKHVTNKPAPKVDNALTGLE